MRETAAERETAVKIVYTGPDDALKDAAVAVLQSHGASLEEIRVSRDIEPVRLLIVDQALTRRLFASKGPLHLYFVSGAAPIDVVQLTLSGAAGVVFLFDATPAGVEASERAIDELEAALADLDSSRSMHIIGQHAEDSETVLPRRELATILRLRGRPTVPMTHTGSGTIEGLSLLLKGLQPIRGDDASSLGYHEVPFDVSKGVGESIPGEPKTPPPRKSGSGGFSLGDPDDDSDPHRGGVPHRGGSVDSSDWTTVSVYFGTDRKPYRDARERPWFQGRGDLTCGRAEVSIPHDHRMGKLEKPRWWLLELRPDPRRHVMVNRVSVLSTEAFTEQLRRDSAAGAADALLFIHGYNVSFEDALRRAAQLAYDLDFPGLAMAYSWPSEAALIKYTNDEANVQRAVAHLRTFLDLVLARSGIRTVSVIAHSMGNRALVDCLKAFGQGAMPAGPGRLGQVVFAAPDVDAELFSQAVREFPSAVERFTLYASSKDKALRVSKLVHGYPRAGESGRDLVVVDGIDTVDASATDTSFLGHSYFGDRRSVLADLFSLVRDGLPPEKRFGLAPRQREDRRYWLYRP